MIIDEQVRQSLERRHGFESWRGERRLEDDLFIMRFFLTGLEFGGWQARLMQFIEPDEVVPWPRVSATLAAGEGAAVKLDVYECASRLAAHDFMLEALASFQLPRVGRIEEGQERGLGDVVFSTPRGTSVVFARGNLVVFVRNASRGATDVTPFARAFDEYLIAEPSETNETLTPQVEVPESLPPEGLTPDSPLPLRVVEAEPSAPRVWYKFFSPSGSVREREGTAFYRPEAADAPEEAHSIRVYAVAPGDGVGKLSISLGTE
jgi:hypothetical protein